MKYRVMFNVYRWKLLKKNHHFCGWTQETPFFQEKPPFVVGDMAALFPLLGWSNIYIYVSCHENQPTGGWEKVYHTGSATCFHIFP